MVSSGASRNAVSAAQSWLTLVNQSPSVQRPKGPCSTQLFGAPGGGRLGVHASFGSDQYNRELEAITQVAKILFDSGSQKMRIPNKSGLLGAATALLAFAGILVLLYLTAPMASAALPECVDHGQTCVIGGTPCCNADDDCKGKFPNTTCQR
jgi:hypothetical protein